MNECNHILDYYLCQYCQRHNKSTSDHPCKFAVLDLSSNKTLCNKDVNVSKIIIKKSKLI